MSRDVLARALLLLTTITLFAVLAFRRCDTGQLHGQLIQKTAPIADLLGQFVFDDVCQHDPVGLCLRNVNGFQNPRKIAEMRIDTLLIINESLVKFREKGTDTL